MAIESAPTPGSQPQKITAALDELGTRIQTAVAQVHTTADHLLGAGASTDQPPAIPVRPGNTADLAGWLHQEMAKLEAAIKRLI